MFSLESSLFFQPVVVAVSGGPDSMALAHFLYHSHPGRVVALTVDHGLRPESCAEAHQVHQWLSSWGMEHHILAWKGEKPKSRVQELARDARYSLLSGWCLANGISVLATAHHQHDQAETVLMRLMKGSGVLGLAGMEEIAARPWGTLVRPLLKYSRADILDYIDRNSIPHVMDPSNNNDKFERIRWRHILSTPAGHGLTLDSVLHLQQKMRQLLPPAPVLERDEQGVVQVPYELAPLSAAIRAVGEGGYPPSVDSLTNALIHLKLGKARTLGGCILRPRKKCIRVIKETCRRASLIR
jgi:tRNA(Ile)-lysidine synthase